MIEIEDIARNYRELRLITPKPVLVEPMMAWSCVGPTKKFVAASRKRLGPHANSSIKIYMNDLAADAFSDGSTSYAVGSVIVKEKLFLGYRDTSGKRVERGDGVGGMVKRTAGFDADHGDWEYFFFESPDDIERGRIKNCVKCHQGAKSTDYVFGSWHRRTAIRAITDVTKAVD